MRARLAMRGAAGALLLARERELADQLARPHSLSLLLACAAQAAARSATSTSVRLSTPSCARHDAVSRGVAGCWQQCCSGHTRAREPSRSLQAPSPPPLPPAHDTPQAQTSRRERRSPSSWCVSGGDRRFVGRRAWRARSTDARRARCRVPPSHAHHARARPAHTQPQQESIKTKHPQLLYESKVYKILQGGGE